MFGVLLEQRTLDFVNRGLFVGFEGAFHLILECSNLVIKVSAQIMLLFLQGLRMRLLDRGDRIAMLPSKIIRESVEFGSQLLFMLRVSHLHLFLKGSLGRVQASLLRRLKLLFHAHDFVRMLFIRSALLLQ